MGKRGPAPKPTAQKVLEGNLGKRKLNTAEPQFAEGAVPPPWLNDRAGAEWALVAAELQRLGMLMAVDRSTLGIYCSAVADVEAFSAMIDEQGRMIEMPLLAKNGDAVLQDGKPVMIRRANPAMRWLNEARKLVRLFGSEFGFSPSMRTRIPVKPSGRPEARIPTKLDMLRARGPWPPPDEAADETV